MDVIFWDRESKYPILILQTDAETSVRDWDEYHARIDALYAMAADHEGYVYLIFDARDTHLPPGNAIAHLRQGFEATPENVRVAYMITQNPVVRRMVEIVMRLIVTHPAIKKYQFVRNMDEAYRRIRSQEGDIA